MTTEPVTERSANATGDGHNLTFVCCVEAGGLEEQTVRMVDSLRRWGGALAGAPVVAVSPRLGVPLSRRTRERFDLLDVRYLRVRTNRRHDWFKFLNKPYALVAAAEVLGTPQVCWIDSDVLILREPGELVLADGLTFSACASDRNIGTNGDDANTPYWTAIAELFDLRLADLPLVTALEENVPIHFYFNSGVFSYRADTGFARRYLEACIKVLESGIASKSSGIFFTDQVALGLVAIAMGLRWRELPLTHNYPVNAENNLGFSQDKLRAAAICHYHDCLWGPNYDAFVGRLERDYPEVAAWVRTDGPLQNRMPLPWKAANAVLREWRERRTQRWARQCRVL